MRVCMFTCLFSCIRSLRAPFAFPSQCARKGKKENFQDRPDVSLDNSCANSVISSDSLRDRGLPPPSRHQNPKHVVKRGMQAEVLLNASFSSEKMCSGVGGWGMKLKALIYVKRKKMWVGKIAELDPPFHRDDAILKINV